MERPVVVSIMCRPAEQRRRRKKKKEEEERRRRKKKKEEERKIINKRAIYKCSTFCRHFRVINRVVIKLKYVIISLNINRVVIKLKYVIILILFIMICIYID